MVIHQIYLWDADCSMIKFMKAPKEKMKKKKKKLSISKVSVIENMIVRYKGRSDASEYKLRHERIKKKTLGCYMRHETLQPEN